MWGGLKEELGEGTDEGKRGTRKVFFDMAWYKRRGRYLYFHLYLYFCLHTRGEEEGGCLDLAWDERKEELDASCSDLGTNSGHSPPQFWPPTTTLATNNSGHYQQLWPLPGTENRTSIQTAQQRDHWHHLHNILAASREVKLFPSWIFIGHLHFAQDPLFCIPVLQTWPLWAERGLRAILAKHHLANSASFAL